MCRRDNNLGMRKSATYGALLLQTNAPLCSHEGQAYLQRGSGKQRDNLIGLFIIEPIVEPVLLLSDTDPNKTLGLYTHLTKNFQALDNILTGVENDLFQ